MKNITRLFAMLIILGAVAAFSQAAPKDAPAAAASAATDTALFATSRPEHRDFKRRVPWIGTVESQTAVEVTALTAGRLESFAVTDQARVTAGQPLAKLGGAPIREERARLEGEIDTLQKRGELNRKKMARLQESLQEQLATKDQVTAAQDEQDLLDAQLHQAGLDLQTLQKQTTVTAPIAGTFTRRRVNAGQEISAGQTIATIIDTDHLRITASLFPPPGIDLQDKDVTIRLNTQTLAGRVDTVLPLTNESGATQVWIESPAIEGKLRPGQTAAGEVTVEEHPEALAVPQAAVVYDDSEAPFVLIRQDGDYLAKPVRLGLTQDGWVEVLGGLEPTQPVVTRGAYELFHRQFNRQFKVQD